MFCVFFKHLSSITYGKAAVFKTYREKFRYYKNNKVYFFNFPICVSLCRSICVGFVEICELIPEIGWMEHMSTLYTFGNFIIHKPFSFFLIFMVKRTSITMVSKIVSVFEFCIRVKFL